ncbi:MAG: TfoX/Sxy family protein [Flavobacteriales bacterium]|nr:TfoX/Sxy family protein [Flavobacteriales bacterium]
MAFDIFLADRLRILMKEKSIAFYEKKMFGGLCFMVDDKMCLGLMFNKKHGLELLMVRIGDDACQKNNSRLGFNPMDFTGRPMKGFAFIGPEGYDSDDDLEHWVQLCIEFNPLAIE